MSANKALHGVQGMLNPNDLGYLGYTTYTPVPFAPVDLGRATISSLPISRLRGKDVLASRNIARSCFNSQGEPATQLIQPSCSHRIPACMTEQSSSPLLSF